MRNDICLSIGHLEYSEVLEHLKNVALAEIRMDLLNLTNEQFATIFKNHNNLIATYRTTNSNYEQMVTMLNLALDNGCKYVDIDISVPQEFTKSITSKVIELKRKLILSYHNFIETPDIEELERIIDQIKLSKANISKIACMANTAADCERILGLYTNHTNLVAFCMGEIGSITRLTAPILGAPFTFASLHGKETAPGQLSYNEIEKHLNSFNPMLFN